jgi:hypothetical protein
MSAIIEAALVKAGLLSATATEAEITAALGQVYARLALATSTSGQGLTASQVAAQLAANDVAAGGIARELLKNKSIESLSWATKNYANAARYLSPSAREAAKQGAKQLGKRAIGGAFGALSWPAWLAGVAILGAITAGGWMYTNKDKPSVDPVKPGARMFGPQMPRDLPTGESEPLRATDEFYLYAINTSGWSFYIARPSDIENKPSNGFTDGGTSTQPMEYRKLLDKAFKDPDAARSYLKLAATPGKHSVWTGQWYKFSGEEFRGLHVGL